MAREEQAIPLSLPSFNLRGHIILGVGGSVVENFAISLKEMLGAERISLSDLLEVVCLCLSAAPEAAMRFMWGG